MWQQQIPGSQIHIKAVLICIKTGIERNHYHEGTGKTSFNTGFWMAFYNSWGCRAFSAVFTGDTVFAGWILPAFT